MASHSSMLTDKLYKNVETALAQKKNQDKYRENLDKYLSANSDKYFINGPGERPIFSDSNINNCEFQKTKLENLDLSDKEFTNLKIDSQKLKGLILNMNQALIIANLLGIKIKN